MRTVYRLAARAYILILHIQEVLHVEGFQGNALYAADYFKHNFRYALQVYGRRRLQGDFPRRKGASGYRRAAKRQNGDHTLLQYMDIVRSKRNDVYRHDERYRRIDRGSGFSRRSESLSGILVRYAPDDMVHFYDLRRHFAYGHIHAPTQFVRVLLDKRGRSVEFRLFPVYKES